MELYSSFVKPIVQILHWIYIAICPFEDRRYPFKVQKLVETNFIKKLPSMLTFL